MWEKLYHWEWAVEEEEVPMEAELQADSMAGV
jgi:hypothetical protein